MKINGIEFNDIYRALPWTFRALIIISAAFILFIIIHLTRLAVEIESSTGPGPLSFRQLSSYNGYDPALAADPAGRALLAFSDMLKEHQKDGNAMPGITLAAATAPCATWSLVGGTSSGFTPYEDSITAPDGRTTIAAGAWRYETPAIVFDKDDAAAPWKLFAYKYMWTHDRNLAVAKRYGFIVMRTATDPEKEWSRETALFGAKADYPPPPYQEMTAHLLSTLDPALADVTAYARPSVVADGGGLVMSLSAFTGGDTPDRTIMIASGDHGATWRYLGAPITTADAKALGFDALAGATLLKKGNMLYLAAVFGEKLVRNNGTHIFPFEDAGRGLLVRAGTGAPVALKNLPRSSVQPTMTGGGFAAYTDACPDLGILTGEDSGLRKAFQIFITREQPD